MDTTVARAINSINQLLEDLSEYHDISDSKLIDTCTALSKLLESDSSINPWTLLFCRQLNRLMDYNFSLPENFWINLCEDIYYVIDWPNKIKSIDNDRKHVHKRMNLEEKLVQRELKFQQTFNKRKCLNELFDEHQTFFDEYLQKCIHLHSKVPVHGLVKDLCSFLASYCGLIDSSSIEKNWKYLNEQLNCIEIPLDCSTRVLEDIQSEFYKYINSHQRVNNNFNNFLPSVKQQVSEYSYRRTLIEVLRNERWIVILGDPGSAKTSLLRWLTCTFAETAYHRDEEVVLEEKNYVPVRIPILVRIGEFAVWLTQNQNKTLMDYIGKHTWLSHTYTCNDSELVLRELIHHGHALILIDGLDEIPEIGQREEITDLVQKFIEEYIHGSDFIFASDDLIYNEPSEYHDSEIIEAQLPDIYGGNQIIITSRIVGYHIHPLNSPFIHQYLLPLMKHEEAKTFVEKWMTQVEASVLTIFMNEGIQTDKEAVENVLKRRENTVQSIFENSSKLLLSNPSLLSLICTLIFRSVDEIQFNSRVQVYYHTIQMAFSVDKYEALNISINQLYTFLINLATYLHLQSPSGLIDTFDLEHLCCFTLRQQHSPIKRKELHSNANQLISLLKSNNSIVDEKGLQVFGFLHLSFQEYFVSQSFVTVSIVEEAIKRFLTFIVNPRFRESLLMVLGWISWKWSSNDYDQFCTLLVTKNTNSTIPFEILLFFDAFNDLQKLPSKSIIFTALTSLLDHPYSIIVERHFMSNLSKLPVDIMTEWMQLYLKNDKRLFKFCQCLYIQLKESSSVRDTISKGTISLIDQQLRSFYNASIMSDFIVDRAFRSTILLENTSDEISSNELYSYFVSSNISTSNIHPLILSTLIAVCGGIHFDSDETEEIKTSFLPKYIYHQSSIISPIIQYLNNNKETHSNKIRVLINQYENVLERASPCNASIDIVDTFVALFCLKGVSEPLVYQKYNGYQAMPIAFARFKRVWFYLQKPFETRHHKYYSVDTFTVLVSDVESLTKVFLSNTTLTDRQRLELSLVCAAALNKLCTNWSSDLFPIDVFLTNNVSQFLGCQPELSHSVNVKESQITKNLHPMQILHQKPYFLLTFVPQSLQKLYCRTFIDVVNETNSLPFVVFLTQCFILLENINNYDPNFSLAFSTLEAQFKQYRLENYALALSHRFSKFSQSFNYDLLINSERQRIYDVTNLLNNSEKDLHLFAASISLARLFRSRENQSRKQITLSTIESEEVCTTVKNIFDPILRIIALSFILDMEKPSIFDEERRDKLQLEMISLLQSILSDSPLLIATLLFIRCYTAHQTCPFLFQPMADIIGKKLNETSINQESSDGEAAYIALQQLNDSDLSPHLSKFIKQTALNLSDVLQFNSSVFYRYFNKTTDDITNSVLMSMLYLTELAFDIQNLKMNYNDKHSDTIKSFKQWKQLQKNSSYDHKRMTFKMATWITNYLQTGNRLGMRRIVDYMFECQVIEEKALLVIEKWLDYRFDKYLRFFTHYAALQLLIEGWKISGLIDIVTEIFEIDKKCRFEPFIRRLFNSKLIDLTTLGQILSILNRHVHYCSKISISVNQTDLYQLIFSLEFEAISNKDRISGILTDSILSRIYGSSHNLQLYLIDHLRMFTNKQSEFLCTSKMKYVASVIKWIIENEIWIDEEENLSHELYTYIYTLLHDQRFPEIQKAILKGHNSLFIHSSRTFRNHIRLVDDAVPNFERLIYSWDIHSRDVLAICLLAYSNCLLKLQTLEIIYNLSNETQTTLAKLFETSSSETISIKAAFCLIIAEQSFATFSTISNWFRDKWDLTSEIQYKILLQRTLYGWQHNAFGEDKRKIVDYLITYSADFLDDFVVQLYNYLCDQHSSTYLFDPLLDYIDIALELIIKDCNAFCDAVRKSWFGEEKFKRQLYLSYKKSSQNLVAIVHMYTMFGVLTVELIEMVTWIHDASHDGIWKYLMHIRRVSNREAIEALFQYLDLDLYNTTLTFFSSIIQLLVQLAQTHTVSSLELHEQISLILNRMLNDDNFKDWCRDESIIGSLLSLSCVKKMNSHINRPLLNESDIDEEFERTCQDQEKKSVLFLRRNYYFSSIF